MNAGSNASHPSIHYYDGDYPSREHSLFPENFDHVTVSQGISHDVARYKEIATQVGGPILEPCCGTGRIAIPLAQLGYSVTGVDVSTALLQRFREKIPGGDPALAERIRLVEQDITVLSLEETSYPLAIVAFNSLLLITSLDDQLQALRRIADHLRDGGLLVLDLVNPLRLKLEGDPVPRPFFTRKNPHNGNTYTRFAMFDALDECQRQRLYGWYDEIEENGTLKRTHYSLHWRPIFRFEIDLMLRASGFAVVSVEGGHLKEPFTAQSPRMFIQAKKAARTGAPRGRERAASSSVSGTNRDRSVSWQVANRPGIVDEGTGPDGVTC